MLKIDSYITDFFLLNVLKQGDKTPWEVIAHLESLINELEQLVDMSEYMIKGDSIVHRSAIIENNVTMKGKIFVAEGVIIHANAYLRGPLIISKNVSIGPSSEIKNSYIGENTRIAHLNYVGNSIIGADVNVEAGAVFANHWNEKNGEEVVVHCNNSSLCTGTNKFGILLGDQSKVGANAVTDPGTILKKGSIVGRLEHVVNMN